jgi:hypothetical protein
MIRSRIYSAFLVCLAAACGGGGGGSSPPTPPPPPLKPALSIAYASPYYAFTVDALSAYNAQHIGPMIVPILPKGWSTPLAWSVSPALPAGLALGAADGSITGVPTAAAAASTYTVTAAYAGTATYASGQASVKLTIAVSASAALDLGHSCSISFMRVSGSRLVSVDNCGRWLLQDIASGADLANGDAACNGGRCPSLDLPPPLEPPPVDVAGPTMMDGTPSGIEIRASSDGHLLASVPGQFTWYELAADGSYVVTGTQTAVTAWSLSGQQLFTRPGNYPGTGAFAAAGVLYLAAGPAGQNVVEAVSVPGGASTMQPAFQGDFWAWFADGSSFLSVLGDTVWVYSNASVQRLITQNAQYSTPQLIAGSGSWFWVENDGNLNVYAIGAPTTVAYSSTCPAAFAGGNVFASGSTLGVYCGGQLTVVDLSAASPAAVNYALPGSFTFEAYAATSAAAWFAGDANGLVLDGSSLPGTPRYLTLGMPFSIAGGSDFYSVATAAGKILSFDAQTNAEVGEVDFTASALSSSSSGSVLAASGNGTLNVYSLPSGALINSLSYTSGSPGLTAMTLSASGTQLALFLSNNGNGCVAEVIPVAGGPPLWCITSLPATPGVLSPDLTLLAVTSGTINLPDEFDASASIYQNGTLLTTVAGIAPGWLDDGHLLVNQYATMGGNGNIPVFVYSGSLIYSPQGQNLTGATQLNVPTGSFIALSSTSAYFANDNALHSLATSTGGILWESGDTDTESSPTRAAVSGAQIVFWPGPLVPLVLAQPF